jgi:16S rRNA (uracil1498-N3)-methyltransferase
MRVIRIYQAGQYATGSLVELSLQASQHVGVVLRMKPGDTLILFCGDGCEYSAVIEEVRKKQVLVRVLSCSEVNRESPLVVHLAQAVSKGDSMEFVVQKAVELGVFSITPILSERCQVNLEKERKEKKRQQWQSIAISACEQCGRNKAPIIHQPETLEEYLSHPPGQMHYVLDPKGTKSWKDYKFKGEIALLIGPEGGLSAEEMKFILQHGFQGISLGPRILRTETAAITALSILQAVAGDL